METKRDSLIGAAKNLLWEVGYESMSPRKVLDASGAGQGSLYHHFTGKKELAAEALSQVDAEARAEFDAVLDTADTPLDKLHRFLKQNRNALRGCRLGCLANEASIFDDELREPVAGYFAYVMERLADTIGEAVSLGELPETIDPERLAATLVAAVQGGYVLSRVRNDPNQMRLAMEGAAAMLNSLSPV